MALIGFGDDNEVVAFVAENLDGWTQMAGALEWPARHV